MAKKSKKNENLTLEEKLDQALISIGDEPYTLPENWCWTKIGNISTLYRGVSYKKHEGHSAKNANDCLIMRGGNIREASLDIDNDNDNVYVDKKLVSDEQLVKKHDVVIVSSTGSKKVIGRAGISFCDYVDVAFGAFLTLVRPINNVCKPYVAYYFQSDLYRNRIRELASGVNINNIKNEHITDTPIPFPPLDEQKRIVERIENLFAKLDEVKEKAQEVIDGFEKRKAAILHKAFSGELTATWRAIHSDQIGEIDTTPLDKNFDNYDLPYTLPKSWRWVRFNECCTFVGSGITPKGGKEVYQLHGVPFIRSQNVLKGALDLSDVAYISPEIDNLMKRTRILGGETLFNITGASIGRSCFVPVSQTIGNVNQHVCIIRYKNYIKSELPQFWLNSPYVQAFVVENQVGQTRQALNFKQIRGMYYPLAPILEQAEMVRILENLLDKEQQAKESAETIIEQIDTIKKSILARAFRGELGTNYPTEESAIELLKEILKGDE